MVTARVASLCWHAPLIARTTVNEEKDISSIVGNNHVSSVGCFGVWTRPNGVIAIADHAWRANYRSLVKIFYHGGKGGFATLLTVAEEPMMGKRVRFLNEQDKWRHDKPMTLQKFMATATEPPLQKEAGFGQLIATTHWY